jgi:acetyl-CoA carboxylase biotin carboxyl carrier protein
MSKDKFSYEELIQIVQLIESSSRFGELHLKVGDVEIELRAKAAVDHPQAGRDEVAAQVAVQGGEVSNFVPIALAEIARSAAPAQQFREGSVLIRSPTIGTFYRAPEPGAKPYVEVGSRVKPDTTVCIIEVMKLMSSLPAEHNGVITHILVDDARLVEAEQVLMVIDPTA